MTEHPSAIRLDAHAAGDEDAGVSSHLATCEACRAYVEALARGAEAFRAREGAEAERFVAALAAREPARAPAPRGRLLRLSFVAAPALAAAAALLLLLRPPAPGPADPVPPVPTIRFKGDLQVGIVRDRAGEQVRLTSEVPIRAGDRLRVEVAVDDARPIVAGVLGKDGSWLVLLAPSLLEAGTHYSEQAARIDEAPSEGWILAGEPDAVERARTTRLFEGVTAIPVVVER